MSRARRNDGVRERAPLLVLPLLLLEAEGELLVDAHLLDGLVEVIGGDGALR